MRSLKAHLGDSRRPAFPATDLRDSTVHCRVSLLISMVNGVAAAELPDEKNRVLPLVESVSKIRLIHKALHANRTVRQYFEG